jgi:DNA-binding GntR family transcriptional regulator
VARNAEQHVTAIKTPRYVEVARTLREEIAAGAYPLGDMLPTELELCRAFDISRHTARDALRVLRDEGLIARRRGAGTTVVARARPAAFTQPIGGLDELLQYARDARLEIRAIGRVEIAPEDARVLRVQSGQRWLEIDGVRRSADGGPIAFTRVFIHPAFADLEPELMFWDKAYSELLESRRSVRVARIEQDITAIALSPEDARAFGLRAGAPALRTVRRYLDSADQVLIASDSRHPGDRFVYTQSFTRDAR